VIVNIYECVCMQVVRVCVPSLCSMHPWNVNDDGVCRFGFKKSDTENNNIF